MDSTKMRKELIEQRERLQADRDRSEGRDVEAQQQELASDATSFDQHPADQGTETLERERALAVMEQIDARIAELDAALARLDQGKFGICEVCGKTIPAERLEARPEARFCVEHQAEIESGARPAPSV